MAKVSKLSAKVVRRKPRTDGVLSRIAPVSLDESEGMTVALYGRSGTGKTTLMCTFPKPLLIIGSEKGTRSVHKVKGVDYVKISESSELPTLVSAIAEGKLRYNTVGLDTATMLQDIILREILGVDQLPAQKSWGMASRDQYGQCSLQTKECLRSLLSMSDNGTNVVIVSQERNFNDEADSDLIMPHVGSALTPSVAGWLNPAVDYIMQTLIRPRTKEKTVTVGVGKKKRTITKLVQVPGVEFCVRTAPDPVYTTKFRLPKGTKLPDVIVDPDYEKILNLVKGD